MIQQQAQSNGANGNSLVPDPLEVLPEVIMSYLNYANGLAQRKDLDVTIQGRAMLEAAQSIQFIVPLLPSSHLMVNKAKALANQPSPEDLQMKQAELQMKAQAHQQDLQMKAQSHQMDMAKSQHELQMKQQEMQMKQNQAAMELQHKQETHQQDIVHSEEAHTTQLQQQKQAAQQKQSSKQGS